jgi:mannosyl-oligosaccharide alpha-1,2-mannosidase
MRARTKRALPLRTELQILTCFSTAALISVLAFFIQFSSYLHPASDRRRPSSLTHLYASSLTSPLYDKPFPDVRPDTARQDAIRAAFQFAWSNYAQFCWGNDELRPMTGRCLNRLYAGLTIVDSLSTLYVMGLHREFQHAREFVAHDFAPHGNWTVFEFIIRFVGSFISAYELTGDPLFLDKAVDCAAAVVPLFDPITGIPLLKLHLGATDGGITATGTDESATLAEAGSSQLEFLALAGLTGHTRFADVALRFYRFIWPEFPGQGLIDAEIDRQPIPVYRAGAGSDSYYEYVLKSYILTGGTSPALLARYNDFVRDVRQNLTFRSVHAKLAGVGTREGDRLIPAMDHLSAFLPGLLALGTVRGNPRAEADLSFADELVGTFSVLQQTWRAKVVPEKVLFNTDNASRKEDVELGFDEYWLRPEVIESIYVLWKFTGLQKYRDIAWEFFLGIEESCKVQYGYARAMSIGEPEKRNLDMMDSFFLAETLKYLYLIFDDSRFLSPTEWVFSTEGQPFRIMSDRVARRFKKRLQLQGLTRLKVRRKPVRTRQPRGDGP